MATVVRVQPTGAKFRDGCKVHWQVTPNPAERRLKVGKETFCKQGPANARAGEIRDKIHRGVYVADDSTTVSEWAEKWLTACKLRGLRPATLSFYGGQLRLRILPAFGTQPMVTVRRDQVRAAAASWATLPAAAEQAVETLRTMYSDWAKDDRPLPRGNPASAITVPQPDKAHTDPLTIAQVHAWRDALPEDMRAIVDIEAYTGGRMNEILGLIETDFEWIGRDVSAPLADGLRRLAELPPERYEERCVTLRTQAQLGRRNHNGGASVRVPTKNKLANRTLPVEQSLTATLAEHFAKYPPVDHAGHRWLFTNRRRFGGGSGALTAHPRPYQGNVYSRWLRRAAAAARVPLPDNQCSHALRHHRVSVLRDAGIGNDRVAEWIGDTEQTVMLKYGAPMHDSKKRTAAVISRLDAEATAGRRLRVVGDGA
jgi:integrase